MTENIRRVVITGLGIVSPVGSTVNKAWDNIKNGVSGIRKINSFDASAFSVQIAGSVIDFNSDDYITPKNQKKMDTFIHYGIGASAMAIEDSGLEINDQNRDITDLKTGKKVSKNFTYSSDNNTEWMTQAKLKNWLKLNKEYIGKF